MKRKVITGSSSLTCYGNDLNKILMLLNENKDKTSLLNNCVGKVNKAYQINDLENIYDQLNLKPVHCLNRTSMIGIISAVNAYNDANLNSFENISLTGAYPGIYIPDDLPDINNLDDLETMYLPLTNPTTILVQIGKLLDIHNTVHMVGAICASGIDAVIDICNQIELGQTEVGIAVGCDSPITSSRVIKGLDKLKVVSRLNLCRPFDKDRDGLVVGEGGAALVIEELEHAKKNNKKILAEIKGFGNSFDAVSVVSPSLDGILPRKSIIDAINNSDIKFDDVDLIFAHGTSTVTNDSIEAKNINSLFNYNKTYVTAIKSHVGHTFPSSGIISAAFGVLCINNSIVPGVLNFNEQSDNDPKINISTKIREKDINNVLVNAYGFGGYNSSIIISKYKE